MNSLDVFQKMLHQEHNMKVQSLQKKEQAPRKETNEFFLHVKENKLGRILCHTLENS